MNENFDIFWPTLCWLPLGQGYGEKEEDSRSRSCKVIHVGATVPEVTFTGKQQEQAGRGAGVQGLSWSQRLICSLKI